MAKEKFDRVLLYIHVVGCSWKLNILVYFRVCIYINVFNVHF